MSWLRALSVLKSIVSKNAAKFQNTICHRICTLDYLAMHHFYKMLNASKLWLHEIKYKLESWNSNRPSLILNGGYFKTGRPGRSSQQPCNNQQARVRPGSWETQYSSATTFAIYNAKQCYSNWKTKEMVYKIRKIFQIWLHFLSEKSEKVIPEGTSTK